MYTISYFIDATDNVEEHTIKEQDSLSYWIESMFYAYGSRLVITRIFLV